MSEFEEKKSDETVEKSDDTRLIDALMKASRLLRQRMSSMGDERREAQEKAAKQTRALKLLTLKDEMEQREIADLNSKLAAYQLDGILENAVEASGVKIVTGSVKGATADVLRDMCEKARDKDSSTVIVLAAANEGKVTFAAACGKEAVAKGVLAGKVVKAVAQAAGGNGGGKPDMAMAGAKDVTKISDALAVVKETVLGLFK